MRRIAVGAVVGAVAVVGLAPAPAGARPLNASLRVTGGISVAWHGDPARGCQAGGLCGYRGSLSARIGPSAELDLRPFRGRLEGSVFLNLDDAPVVRVGRDQQGDSGGGCVDLDRGAQMYVDLAEGGHGRVRAQISADGLSSGRCAGPAVARLLEHMPSRSVSLARLLRGGATIDLSSSRAYGAGRFSGTVTSTLKLRVSRPHAGRPIRLVPHRRPTGRRTRLAELHARYRVTSISGKSSSAFQGLTSPVCVTLDACGVAGSATWAVLGSGGEVVVDAVILPRRSEHGVRGALSALADGRGFLDAYGEFPHTTGVTTADVSREGGETCRDTARTGMPPISSSFSPFTGFASSRTIKFEFGGTAVESVDDLARTGCPGPTETDIAAGSPLASGTVPTAALTRTELELRLAGSGRFRSAGYAGTRRARLRIGLRRAGLSVRYKRVRTSK